MNQNQIVCSDVLESTTYDVANLVILDLSLNNLKQYYHEISDNEKYLNVASKILKKAHSMSKSNAFCCVISSDDKDFDNIRLKPFGTKIIGEGTGWNVVDEIIWMKNLDEGDSQRNLNGEHLIDFSETPFSQIWILAKGNNILKNRSHFLDYIRLSKNKKQQLLDSIWYVPQTKISNFKDNLPSELLSRLIICYSVENDLVLVPFASHCLSALVCKSLKRNSLSFTNSIDELKISKQRLENGEINNGQ